MLTEMLIVNLKVKVSVVIFKIVKSTEMCA